MMSRATRRLVSVLCFGALAFPTAALADAYDDAAKGLVTEHGWTVEAATNAAGTLRNMNIPPERSEEFLKAVVWLTPKLAEGHEDDTDAMQGLLKSTMGVLGLGARMWPDLNYQTHAQYILEAAGAISTSCNKTRFESGALVLGQAAKAKAEEVRANKLDGKAFYTAMVNQARQSAECHQAASAPVTSETEAAAPKPAPAPPVSSVSRAGLRRGQADQRQ